MDIELTYIWIVCVACMVCRNKFDGNKVENKVKKFVLWGMILGFLATMMINDLVSDIVLLGCISIDAGLLFFPVCTLKILREIFERIYLIFCVNIKMKSQQILYNDIKNNRIMLWAIMVLFSSLFLLNIQYSQFECIKYIQNIMQIQFEECTEYTIVVSLVGMLAYVVCFYNYVEYLKNVMMTFFFAGIIAVEIVLLTFSNPIKWSLEISGYIIVFELLFNMFFSSIMWAMVSSLSMRISGNNKTRYFKLLFYTIMGYGLSKTFLEVSFSYYQNMSDVAIAKSIIDATIQVVFYGSIFCYAGANLFNKEMK